MATPCAAVQGLAARSRHVGAAPLAPWAPGPAERQAGGVAQPRQAPRQSMWL